MIKNIEPIFVIIDDFSGFGEMYGDNYATGSLGSFGSNTNVCLFDYGFIDFQHEGEGPVIDLQADFVNVTFPAADIALNYEEVMGQSLNISSGDVMSGAYPTMWPDDNFTDSQTFVEAGGFIDHQTGSSVNWQFTPTKDNEYSETDGSDNSPVTDVPAHGDFVFKQFVEQLSYDAAETSHIFLIDVDFGDDLTALTASDTGSAISDMYDSFIYGKYGEDSSQSDTLHPIFGMTASFGGPKGPGSAGDEIKFFAEQPGAVLQASANANQGGYNWATDSDYEYVMTVGAWNMGQDGNIAATEDYLKSEIDVYADGYVDDLYGYSGFGTSYATPAVAAEAMNLMHDAISNQYFQSETEITEFLFDVITPGFQSPELWAEQVADLITTDIEVHFTNGTSQIVQVMTSDLDENGLLSPSQLTGYNGEANYWGKNLQVEFYERVESEEEDGLDFSNVGPQIADVSMNYSGPDAENAGNFTVSIEMTFDTPVSGSFGDLNFASLDEDGGGTSHFLSLQFPGEASTTYTWSMLTGQDPSQWHEISTPVFDNTSYDVMDALGNVFSIDVTNVFDGLTMLSSDVEFTELGSGSDKYYGSDEADYVITGGGADYLSLGKGDDIVAVSGAILSTDINPFDSKSKFAIIDTGEGDDQVVISTDMKGDIKLISGGGDDRLVIEGLPGDFSMSANNNDLVISDGEINITLANQMLIGTADLNTFSYLEYVASDGTSEVFVLDPTAPTIAGAIVSLVGTDNADKLDMGWDSNPGDLKGLAGDDVLTGGGSDDYLDGGTGDDFLFGDSGEDTISGGEGEDFLEGGGGSDYLAGGAGDDVYVIELDYASFLDYAGWDNYDSSLFWDDPSYESPWSLTVGNVDTINDADGSDRLIIVTPPSSLDPFDQYHDNHFIDEEGNLNLNWLVEPASSNTYTWSLHPDYKDQTFDENVMHSWSTGSYMAAQANGTSGAYDHYELVFSDQHSAEWWLSNHGFSIGLNSSSGEIYESGYSKYIKVADAAKNLAAGVSKFGVGKDAKGADVDTKASFNVYSIDIDALQADGLNIQTKFSSVVELQAAHPDVVSVNDIFIKDIAENEYITTGSLSNLQQAGYNLDFDLYKVETWPTFSDLPKATDPASPEMGTQEYWKANFDMFASPPVVPNIWPATEGASWINLEVLQQVMESGNDPLIPQGTENLMWAPISNADAELVQGVEIKNFAFQDEYGNWANTVESVMLLNPSQAHSLGAEILPGIMNGSKSAYDSIDAQKSTEFVEYFLSPSGVVDQGLHKEPILNPDGSVKSFKETTKWDGADTDLNFFLIANEDLAGQNPLSLGFDGNTGVHTDADDRTPNSVFDFGGAVLTSGAAKHDILIGIDDDTHADVMFGHGGADWIAGNAGQNLLVGGSGSDKFVIENVSQNTIIIGDHAKIVDGDFDTENDYNSSDYPDTIINPKYNTVNEAYSDVAFFDFAWPYVDPVTGAKDSNSYIEQLGQNHFKVHHQLDNGETMCVELYDVEGAYFSDGNGGLDFHALTTGRPITSADFIDKTPFQGKTVNYEKNEIKFLVEHNDADYSGATTISVVTTATKTITLADKSKLTYEEPTVHWKGLATEASAFEFADVTVNVINVSETDLTGAPIVDPLVMGTSGIDLIIGDENDNIIYGGESDDIIFGGDGEDTIFGEGGDDVIIGGDMDDILYGDYEFDSDIPDLTLDDNGNVVELPAHLAEGNDVIVGGAGRDEIVSGEGNNVVASGDLSAVILNSELDDDHAFLNYDEDDLVT